MQVINLHDAIVPKERISPQELKQMSRKTASRIIKKQGNFEARNEALTHALKQPWTDIVEPISDALRLERIDGPPTIKTCMLNSLGKHVT